METILDALFLSLTRDLTISQREPGRQRPYSIPRNYQLEKSAPSIYHKLKAFVKKIIIAIIGQVVRLFLQLQNRTFGVLGMTATSIFNTL